MSDDGTHASALLAAMPEGIGDLMYASPEWVEAASDVLAAVVAKYADGLKDLEKFTLCVVAHNPPAYLHCGASLAWHAAFDGSTVKMKTTELPANDCDFKVQGDHSILSNLARIQHYGRDPKLVAAARERLAKLS